MPDQQQLEAMLRQAAQKLGTSPEQLKNSAQNGQLNQLLSGLSSNDAATLQKVLTDKNAANKLLSTPQAQQLLKTLMGGK